MSFWSQLFGADAEGDIDNAKAKADPILDQGLAKAEDSLLRGRNVIGYGTAAADNAFTAHRDAGLSSLLNAKTASLNDIAIGRDNALADLGKRYGEAEGAATSMLDRATSYYRPYLESGQGAQKLLADLQGLNGPDAQRAAQANYAQNPGLQYQVDRALKAVDAQRRAIGMSDSGATTLAAQRVASEMQAQDFDKWYSSITDSAAKGGQYASRVADMTTTTGQLLAQLKSQLGGKEADVQTGSAAASAGINTGAGKDAANMYGQSGQMIAGNINQGAAGQSAVDNALASMQWGGATTKAGNEINYGNAMAQAGNVGINNLLSLAKTGAEAAKAGASWNKIG